jgi:peptide/nickel transport system substrate-binding protein
MWSRRAKRRAYVVGLSLLACAGLGCSQESRGQATSAPITVSIGVAAPEGGGDPGLRTVADHLSVEYLLTIDNDGRPAPLLAERWQPSNDGLTWRFELRNGVAFHDGTALTAEHVAASLNNALRRPGVVAQAPSFQQVSSITADGPRSLTITLDRPSALLLSDLAFVEITTGTANQPAGTGPFIVESRDDKRIVLRRFDGYREGPPTIERVELSAFPTVRNAWTALMRGEVDSLYEVGADAAEFVSGESSVQTFTFMRPYTVTLGFNVRHPILQSREVRRALNRAVDRDAIVRSAYRGRGRPAQDPIWPSHWASSQATPTYAYNPEAAKLGFTAAGYGQIRKTGSMPSRFQLRCLVYPPLERVALLVQKQLYEIGVDMTIELTKLSEMGSRLGRGDFDAFLFWQLSGRSLTWPYLFWHSPEAGRPVFIQTGYSAADETLDQVRYARTDEEFRNAVAAFQRVMHDDPPAIFLAWEERMRAVSREFQVPQLDAGRDVIATIWRWRPEGEANASAR